MKDYKLHNYFGIGGMRCPCCNNFHSKGKCRTSMKVTKQKVNRIYRRKNKKIELE